jgi:flavin-dependent dehydrogenase
VDFPETYDVIIAGGGLAGLSIAIQFAAGGRKTLLLEKNKYPFHRVCGEYVSMESWDFLERIGFPFESLSLPRITELKVSSVKGNTLVHPLNPGGFGISRYLFDATLAGIARKNGAVVLEEMRVDDTKRIGEEFEVVAGKTLFRTKLLIGAHGKRSNIDKKLNRSFISNAAPASNNWIGVKYHIRASLPSNRIELHNFDGGYCGISKIESDQYCLCYLTKASNIRKYNGNIKVMETELLSANPFLKEYFSSRENFIFDTPETIAQVSFENKTVVENGILIAGDAAGMIAPLCGNGMSMALHSSKILFQVAEKFLSGKISRIQMEKEYSHKWRSAFSARLKAGRFFQPLLVKSFLSIQSIALLKHTPAVMSKIIGLTHGRSF